MQLEAERAAHERRATVGSHDDPSADLPSVPVAVSVGDLGSCAGQDGPEVDATLDDCTRPLRCRDERVGRVGMADVEEAAQPELGEIGRHDLRGRKFRETLKANGLTGSMGRVSSAADNASMESF